MGAVAPGTGRKHGLILDHLDTEAMNLFLLGLSKRLSRWKHAILVDDGTGWHRSEGLRAPRNIALLTLPPYSPELNPIERLWLWMKDNFLSNRIFKDMDAIFEAGVNAWNEVTVEVVKSVCASPLLEPLH